MKKRTFTDPLLPASSSNEDLETLSRNKLSALFDLKLFEVRAETQRDKGIDLTIELKQSGYYTNFRFAIQLKATASVRSNKDGSVSFPIELNNINYLLNNGMPAYYILYQEKGDKFFVENVNDVYGSLIKKYQRKQLPEGYKVRFSKLLTPELIKEIYQQTLIKGTLLNKLNHHLSFSSESKPVSGIAIDEDNEVYSVEQNIAFINQFGFELLNNTEFIRIIEIEQRTHPRTSASPVFNLVCGMAYYQRSNLFKALELLKLAQQELSAFNPEIQSMLTYTLIHAKYLLGMMNEESFKTGISQLMDVDDLGSFLQLEKAYKVFMKHEQNDKERLITFYEATKQILSEDNTNNRALTIAYARLLDAEEQILVSDLSKNVVLICGRVTDYKKTKTYETWVTLEAQYTQRLNSVLEFAFNQKDFMSMSNLGLDKTRWVYAKIFLHHIFNNWNKNTLTVDGSVNEADKENLLKHIAKLDKLAEGYEILGHPENLVSCLSLKYELLHFIGQMTEADSTAKKIIATIEANDLNGLKGRHNNLINGGTGHERFTRSFTDHLKNIYQVAKASGLSEYMEEDIPEELLPLVEKDIKWSIETFFEFTFPSK